MTGTDDGVPWGADRIVPYDGGALGDPFNPVKPVYLAVRDWWLIARRETAAR